MWVPNQICFWHIANRFPIVEQPSSFSVLLISFLSYQTKALIQKVRTKIRETINQESSNKNLFYQLHSITYEVFRGKINPIAFFRRVKISVMILPLKNLNNKILSDWFSAAAHKKSSIIAKSEYFHQTFPAFNRSLAHSELLSK